MGKSSKVASGADHAGTLLWFAPEKLTVVTDKNHPLYDERAGMPLDESLVLNVMVHGVQTPIKVRHNGYDEKGKPIVEVVFGRQRVRAALEANRRLTKEGKEPIRVPATTAREEQHALMGFMISENAIRRDDSPLVRARKLSRYLALGRSEEEAAIVFGVTVATVKNMLKVLELHPTVQRAINDGLPVNVAKELHALPQEEQPAALEKLAASGNVKGDRGIQAAKNLKNGRGAEASKVRMMSRHQVEEWRKQLKSADGKDSEIAYAVLSRLLGHERALAQYPRLRDTLESAENQK